MMIDRPTEDEIKLRRMADEMREMAQNAPVHDAPRWLAYAVYLEALAESFAKRRQESSLPLA